MCIVEKKENSSIQWVRVQHLSGGGGWLVQFGGGQIPSRLAAANQIKYNRNNIAPEIPGALCIVANKITNNERGGGWFLAQTVWGGGGRCSYKRGSRIWDVNILWAYKFFRR